MEQEVSFFEQQEIVIGDIVAGTKHVVIFKARPNIPDIKDIAVECGCTSPRYSQLTRELKVTYTSGSIKNTKLDSVNFSKFVTVHYKGDAKRKEVLRINGTKKRKL